MAKESQKPMRTNMSPQEFWKFQDSLGFKDHTEEDDKFVSVYNANGKLVTKYDKAHHIIKIY